jgi:hypothetical protein
MASVREPVDPTRMSRALQIYYTAFDEVFLGLPDDVRRRIEAALDDMGLRLNAYL